MEALAGKVYKQEDNIATFHTTILSDTLVGTISIFTATYRIVGKFGEHYI